jgi:hypothetical protein
MNIIKYDILLTGPVHFSIVFGRASFCLFLLSTIGAKKYIRTLLWVTLILQALVNGAIVILQYSACGTNITSIWDHSVQAKCIGFHTIVNYMYFVSGLYSGLLGKYYIR